MIVLGRPPQATDRIRYTITAASQPNEPVKGMLQPGSYISINLESLGLQAPFSVSLHSDCIGGAAQGDLAADVIVALNAYPGKTFLEVRDPVDSVD